MPLINAVVSHAVYGRGIIADVSDKCVFVVFDKCPAETKKFQYPLCFEHILKLENLNNSPNLLQADNIA